MARDARSTDIAAPHALATQDALVFAGPLSGGVDDRRAEHDRAAGGATADPSPRQHARGHDAAATPAALWPDAFDFA